MGIASCIKLLTFASLLTTLPFICTAQPKRTSPLNVKVIDSSCVSPLDIKSPALLNELKRFFASIQDYELPIIALETRGDSSFCYVSALISTHDIQQNPPTAIVKILNREALLYTGNESIGQLTVDCKQYLIRKYLNILHVDKINKKYGSPPGTPMGGTYDPVLVKISVRGTKVMKVTNPDKFPFLTY
jgi:hypothetical protein